MQHKLLFCIGFVGIIGAIVSAFGAVLYVALPSIVKTKLMETLRLVKGSEVYDTWVEPDMPVYVNFYFFNVTNHKTVFLNGNKPILQQLGPYTFREYLKKVNINYNNVEDTISYNQIKWFVYLPSKSIGSLSDKVTTLNLPYVSLSTLKDKKLNLLEKLALPQIIKNFNTSLFMTKTVEELLFKGYQDDMMIYLHKKSGKTILPNGTFGYLYGKNNTSDGTYTIFSGINNQDKFMEIYSWNNLTNIKWWNSEYCNMINGTDGTKYKSYLSRNDTLYAFDSDLCRSVQLKYEKDETIHEIPTYRFSMPISMLESADIEPDNKCFCNKTIGCLKRGAFYSGVCNHDAPIVTTLPHFYNADESYYEAVIGLNKSRELHNSFSDIEPNTGYIVRARRRGQLNVALRPLSHFRDFQNLPEMLFPIMWLDENVVWPRDFADSFSNRLFKLEAIVGALSIAFIVLGSVTIILSIFIAVVKLKLKKKKSGNKQENCQPMMVYSK